MQLSKQAATTGISRFVAVSTSKIEMPFRVPATVLPIAFL
jgi:hypothetical protein